MKLDSGLLQYPVYKNYLRDFPGGPVFKNSPANARDMGLIPGPGRSHMPQGNYVHVPQLLSPQAATTDVWAPRACALQQERPPQWEARSPQQEKALTQQGRPSTATN